MAVSISGNDDFVTGIKVVATRKGHPWLLPPDLSVVSMTPNVAGASLAGDVVTVTRAGAPDGPVDVVVTGGGLSATLHVDVAAAVADALAIDESGATNG